MSGSWLVLLPPIVVLLIALFFRNVLAALISGIITAAFIVTKGSLIKTISFVAYKIYHELSDLDHLYTFGFLLLLGVFIELLTRSGGIKAYSHKVKQYIKDQQSTQKLSLVVSSSFFLDDYLNSLTTGAIMRPLTDHFKIPRAKLAFLLDSMSAPLCVLVPATSWIAMILIQLQVSGISTELSRSPQVIADPFGLYLQCIAYLFYPIFIVVSAWIIVQCNISFGTMHKYELIALQTGNLFGNKKPLHVTLLKDEHPGYLRNFFIPLGFFLSSLLISLLYTGNFRLFGGTNSFIAALLSASIFSSLFYCIAATLILSFALYHVEKTLKIHESIISIYHGFNLMKNSCFVLLLAWTLSNILKNDLQTGQYIAHIALGNISQALIPLLFFLTSLVISGSTGSAWGTIALMMPLGIPFITALSGFPLPILAEQLPLLAPTIGAIVAGAVAGCHFSPITDSTVLASTSAGCYHLDHVYTQMSYSFPALIGSIIAFLIVGLGYVYQISFTKTLLMSLISGLLVTIIIIFIRNNIKKL